MFKRRLLTTLATVAFVAGVLGAGPAKAQAPLGFTIDPTQGLPGDTVTGQVNVADVAASCVTDLTEFQARFNAVTFDTLAFNATAPLWPEFFPPDTMDLLTTIQTHDQRRRRDARGSVLTSRAMRGPAQRRRRMITFVDKWPCM